MQLKNVYLIKTVVCLPVFATIFALILLSCNSQPKKESEKEPEKKEASNKDWEGKIMTVNGLVPADSMGITMPHEHLLIVHQGPAVDLTDEATAISELKYYAEAGGKTLAELTTIGIGRKPEALKRISTATSTNIIMGAGFYKDKWLPDSIKNQTVEQLTNTIVSDIMNGLNGIHAGVIGEIGISNPITPFEEKELVAVARAQKATGASVNVHFDIEDDLQSRNYALDILEKEGADLTRVAVSHNPPFVVQLEDFIALAKRGVYVEFDLFGLEIWKAVSDQLKGKVEPVKVIKALIEKGYLNNILIAQDLCSQVCYKKNGGYGYEHIIKNVVPQFKAGGITDEQIKTIMVENPRRLLPFKIYADK